MTEEQQIQKLEAIIKTARANLVSLHDKCSVEKALIRECQLKLHEFKHGIKPGVIVVYHGVLHKVVSIEPDRGFEKPWVTGNPQRKDGTYGTAVRNLFDNWELPQ